MSIQHNLTINVTGSPDKKRPGKPKWKKIADKAVRNIWKCEDCDETAEIHPDWYEQNGTPMCTECDRDMVYSHTEIIDI